MVEITGWPIRPGSPDDLAALSLSVEVANRRVFGLYERLGFKAMAGDEHDYTMIVNLRDLP